MPIFCRETHTAAKAFETSIASFLHNVGAPDRTYPTSLKGFCFIDISIGGLCLERNVIVKY